MHPVLVLRPNKEPLPHLIQAQDTEEGIQCLMQWLAAMLQCSLPKMALVRLSEVQARKNGMTRMHVAFAVPSGGP